jgi:transcriptional regulator with XRE-family HTH domain
MSQVTDREPTALAQILEEKRVAKRELARRLLPVGADRKAIDNKRSQINRWANGSVSMSEASAYEVAEALGVEPRLFYKPRVSKGVPVGELETILDRLLSLTPEQQELLRTEAALLADAIRRLSEKAVLVADHLDGLATPHNGHRAGGTSG